MVVAFDGDLPVGVMLTIASTSVNDANDVSHDHGTMAMFFVKNSYRRRGIGTQLLKTFLRKYNTDIKRLRVMKGTDGSIDFFRQNKLRVFCQLSTH